MNKRRTNSWTAPVVLAATYHSVVRTICVCAVASLIAVPPALAQGSIAAIAEGQVTVRPRVTPGLPNAALTEVLSLALADTFFVLKNFLPSGWMGDGRGPAGQRHIRWNYGETNCHNKSGDVCVQVTYTPGDSGWGGMYLQYPVSNWGEFPGRADLKGYRRLSFWSRADSGGVVEFKAGGIYDPRFKNRDSFEVSLGAKALTRTWQHFEIDLSKENLESVIGGFAWIATKGANRRGVTFYLDEIVYLR